MSAGAIRAGRVAVVAGLVAFLLALPLAGIDVDGRFSNVARVAAWSLGLAALVFAWRTWRDRVVDMSPQPGSYTRDRQAGILRWLPWILLTMAILFPAMPLASRYALDIAISILTYIMLGWGLNITVGYAGLLDVGYVGFYAIGAYGYALLAQAGLGFWAGLPLAGLAAAGAASLVGACALRLRGDYFAIVTLGFGEIVRLVAIDWADLTGGPQGLGGIARPTLFGHVFDPAHRAPFLYYVILGLAAATGWIVHRLRLSPLGRAWEALRENEIAAASLGLDRRPLTLAAYAISAAIAGMAGAFFAARQGFISPESFTFTESATLLAIVILGGAGHPLGIAAAAAFVTGLPELFRSFDRYRMIAFGLGMVLVMIVRPSGLAAARRPTARLHKT